MKHSRKIQVLSQIQAAIGREQPPTPPSVGLTEKEFQEMENEGLFEVRYSISEPEWDDYTIESLSDAAKGLIANAEPLPESRAVKIFRVLGIGLWDLVKIS
jgi:hypothetical protein